MPTLLSNAGAGGRSTSGLAPLISSGSGVERSSGSPVGNSSAGSDAVSCGSCCGACARAKPASRTSAIGSAQTDSRRLGCIFTSSTLVTAFDSLRQSTRPLGIFLATERHGRHAVNAVNAMASAAVAAAFRGRSLPLIIHCGCARYPCTAICAVHGQCQRANAAIVGGNGTHASTCSTSSESAIAPRTDSDVPSTIRPPNISW